MKCEAFQKVIITLCKTRYENKHHYKISEQINYKMSPLWLLTECEKFLKWEAETGTDTSSYGRMKVRK